MTVMNISQLARQLETLGFKSEDGGYRNNGLRARFDRGWLTFQTQADTEGEPIRELSGGPGLWKYVYSPSGRPGRVFDLPLGTITEQEIWNDETGDPLCPLAEMISWVGATSSGKLPRGWKCPPREELEDALPSGALTLEMGKFARQGQLSCEGRRLAVCIPLIQRVPADLTPQRRACLDELLADVQSRSRLVRLVEKEPSESARSILAEVDLSGAPRFAIPRLLRIGLDAVRHAVSHSISAVELLVDPAVTSTVWEVPSVRESPAEGSQK